VLQNPYRREKFVDGGPTHELGVASALRARFNEKIGEHGRGSLGSRLILCSSLIAGAAVAVVAGGRSGAGGEQHPRHGDLGELEHEKAIVPHDPSTDLYELFARNEVRRVAAV
jgi:hypothetical protein